MSAAQLATFVSAFATDPQGGQFRPAGDIELLEDVGEVDLDGPARDEHQLATALRLPESALLEQLGSNQLLRLIEEKIQTANRVIRATEYYTIEQE